MLQDQYRQKLRTPEQAVQVVKSGDWVDYGFGAGFPDRAALPRSGECDGPGPPFEGVGGRIGRRGSGGSGCGYRPANPVSIAAAMRSA